MCEPSFERHGLERRGFERRGLNGAILSGYPYTNSTGINYRSVTGRSGGRHWREREATAGGRKVRSMVGAGVDVIFLLGEAKIFGVNVRNVIMR